MVSSAGTKLTSTDAIKHESVGVVTSDSLAAESLKTNGSFGSGNPKAAASDQPSKSTTTNTTDTSGATKLNSAADAEARDAQQNWSETSQLSAGKSTGKDASIGPTYATNSAAAKLSSEVVSGGYAGAAEKARGAGELRPKGVNLTETDNLGGETAFREIGPDENPSQNTEQGLLSKNSQAARDAGNTKDTSKQEGTSKFSALSDVTA